MVNRRYNRQRRDILSVCSSRENSNSRWVILISATLKHRGYETALPFGHQQQQSRWLQGVQGATIIDCAVVDLEERLWLITGILQVLSLTTKQIVKKKKNKAFKR